MIEVQYTQESLDRWVNNSLRILKKMNCKTKADAIDIIELRFDVDDPKHQLTESLILKHMFNEYKLIIE